MQADGCQSPEISIDLDFILLSFIYLLCICTYVATYVLYIHKYDVKQVGVAVLSRERVLEK